MDEDLLIPNVVKIFAHSEVKAVNEKSREILHLITTDSVDRVGDIVEPQGAEVANFMRHPVVLMDHVREVPNIIARALSIEVSDKGITARTKYRDTPLAQEAFAVVKEGLGAFSIGFRPIKAEFIQSEKKQITGVRYKQWEMLEYSQICIPCNPDIVNDAISRGLITRGNAAAFFVVNGPTPEPTIEVAGGCPTAEEPQAVKSIHPALVTVIDANIARARKRIALSMISARINEILEQRNG